MLGSVCRPVGVRQFPDGESLVRVDSGEATALLFCSLDNPDAKLVQVLLAASALRDSGARRIVLIAPYLGYMRQDAAFASCEAVSQRLIGCLIASAFDALVTVDPHLHRTPRLDDVVPGITAIHVPAAPAISAAITASISPDAILVGPDGESKPWVEAVAAPLRLETMVGEKVRRGDHEVAINFSDRARVLGRPVMLIDDVISAGSTLIACARQLFGSGATSVGAIATHCLAHEATLDLLAADGIVPIIATDTVPGPAGRIPMAAELAKAIRMHGLH